MSDTPTRSSIWTYLMSCRGMTVRDRHNSWRATGWLAGWAASFLGASLLIRKEVIPPGWPSYLAALAPTILAVAAMLAYVRFIREADELHRKIQLEALGLGFAAGFVASFTIEALEFAGVTAMDVGDVFLVMVVFYCAGMVLGARRYA